MCLESGGEGPGQIGQEGKSSPWPWSAGWQVMKSHTSLAVIFVVWEVDAGNRRAVNVSTEYLLASQSLPLQDLIIPVCHVSSSVGCFPARHLFKAHSSSQTETSPSLPGILTLCPQVCQRSVGKVKALGSQGWKGYFLSKLLSGLFGGLCVWPSAPYLLLSPLSFPALWSSVYSSPSWLCCFTSPYFLLLLFVLFIFYFE